MEQGVEQGAERGRKIGQCVHRALGDTLGLRSESWFQIVTEQTEDLLGKRRAFTPAADCSAIVLIYLASRYSGRKTRALFAHIAELLERELEVRDVAISLVKVAAENWSWRDARPPALERLPHPLP